VAEALVTIEERVDSRIERVLRRADFGASILLPTICARAGEAGRIAASASKNGRIR
jgi:hypothetical protein